MAALQIPWRTSPLQPTEGWGCSMRRCSSSSMSRCPRRTEIQSTNSPTPAQSRSSTRGRSRKKKSRRTSCTSSRGGASVFAHMHMRFTQSHAYPEHTCTLRHTTCVLPFPQARTVAASSIQQRAAVGEWADCWRVPRRYLLPFRFSAVRIESHACTTCDTGRFYERGCGD